MMTPKDKQARTDWDRYYDAFVKSSSALSNETESEKKKRIVRLEGDFEEWKKYYFPKYCYAPSAGFHRRASNRILNNDEWYEVRMWARELAKDALCMMETLYQVLTGRKKNILIVSNSFDKAAELTEPYRVNLERNERIINDYGIQQMPGAWAYGDWVTTQGVSFLAIGAGQSPRGSRNEEIRPDKVIYTDLDTDEDVRNKDIIDKRWDWTEKAVYPTRSVSKPFQVVWLGNRIAEDCCVVRAAELADYVDIVNLEDKNGNSSWPEKNSQNDILRIKDKMSTKAYQQEYMNNPLTEGDVFKEMIFGKIPPLSKFRFLVAYGDPAPSNKAGKGASFKSLFLCGELEGKYYIITGYLDQPLNDTFVDWFYEIKDYVGTRTQVYMYLENNKLQDPFYEQVFVPLFAEKGKTRGQIGITPDTRQKPDKFVRIEGNLEPLNRRGALILNEAERDNPHMKRLKDQFLLLSPRMKSPADGPDCIEGGVWIINQKKAEMRPDSISIGTRYTNKKRY